MLWVIVHFTKYAPTAQVAFQQGIYLAHYFEKLQKLKNYDTKSNKILQLVKFTYIDYND